MLLIEFVRDTYSDIDTFSKVYLNGEYFCEGLEDCDRYLELYPERKVYGKTAIPIGRYKVLYTWSNRFQKPMPELLAVPGFNGVRIHGGNTHLDTDGCPLVGSSRGEHRINNSRPAREELYSRVQSALTMGEEVWCEIRRLEG